MFIGLHLAWKKKLIFHFKIDLLYIFKTINNHLWSLKCFLNVFRWKKVENEVFYLRSWKPDFWPHEVAWMIQRWCAYRNKNNRQHHLILKKKTRQITHYLPNLEKKKKAQTLGHLSQQTWHGFFFSFSYKKKKIFYLKKD